MSKVKTLQKLYDRAKNRDLGSRNLDTDIAAALGWKFVQFSQVLKDYWGIDLNGEFMPVPSFTGSYDAAVTIVPENWVESYHRTFDGEVIAECRPRGDLVMRATKAETRSIVTAMLCAALLAQIEVASEEEYG